MKNAELFKQYTAWLLTLDKQGKRNPIRQQLRRTPQVAVRSEQQESPALAGLQ